MINTIHDIVTIKDEAKLLEEFHAFEQALDADLAILRDQLARQPLTNEVLKLEEHMTMVESWRNRVGRRLTLVTAFVGHAKGHHFLLKKGKDVAVLDREAYQKTLTAAMVACQGDLERTIDDIDSRVNTIKKLIGVEAEVGGRRLNR